MTPNNQTPHTINDVVHDALGEVFCGDCEHPRCLNKVKLYSGAIQDIINSEVRQVLDRLEKQSKHYTSDGLVVDALDPWAIPTSRIEAERKRYSE